MTNPSPGMLPDRAVLRLSGEEARDFLQGLVPADIALLTHEAPLWTGLLSPQGKALFDFILWDDRGDILVDCEAAQADALAAKLSAYRLRRRIAIARDAGVARLCLFHHAPLRSDDENDAILARYREVVQQQGDRFELLSAYEGLEILLGRN